MLKKLLKYNLKNQFKFFGLLYGIMIFCALGKYLLGLIEDAPAIIVFVRDFCQGVMWAMAANALLNNILRIWVEFRRSMFRDESYLMHTLPVKTSTFFLSKVLGAIIVLAVNVLVITLSIFVAYGNTELLSTICDILKLKANGLDVSVGTYIALLALIAILEMINVIMIGFLAIILGHKKNSNKTAWSFGFGFGLYLISQIVTISTFAVSGIFKSEMFGLFTGTGSSFDPETTLFLLIEGNIVYALIIAAVGLISAKSLNRGFDID